MPGTKAGTMLGLSSLLIISSCTMAMEKPLPARPGQPPQQEFCPRIHDPVCARRGPDRQTFGNSCEANAAGYRVSYHGQCRRGGAPRPSPPPQQQFCTQQYEPVCARRGNQVRTFGNACEARSADFRIL